jgi:hypothetical protein
MVSESVICKDRFNTIISLTCPLIEACGNCIILNHFKMLFFTCFPLLICRDVGNMKKPHYGSHAIDPMSWNYQGYCSSIYQKLLQWNTGVSAIKTNFIENSFRPNKIKVLVLRQCCPLKISADGTFLLPYRKKIAAAPYF